MNRRWARVRAVQALFQVEMTGVNWKEALRFALDEDEISDEYLDDVIPGTLDNLDVIDAQIKEQLQHWTVERLNNVDFAVLRLAVYELMHRDDIPPHVTLNEAINTAKAFGEEEAGRFVNGVLATILKNYPKEAGTQNDSEPDRR
ncbi:transcription antitermination factor NusB [Geomicrobium sediminis]|uniref:Transcription antitermination protein NusB n=1 Tax=Geomicrobium sediminis TaxID=1347788 RepID=A0ABS2PDZ9_9BACL|nr:transcription antitermination factor NusB [Geomicrobium sediminis]MBM7633648.1 N utilization substance protein B [Geomicrobium sediminis]